MVLSPNQARRMAENNHAPTLAKLERTIDATLAKSGGMAASLSIETGYRGLYDDPRNDVPNHLIESLLDNYRQAGWKVKMEHDQREGTYLTFQPKTEAREGTVEMDDLGQYGR